MRETSKPLIIASTGAVILALTASAHAGPFDPAYRGQPNSVHAIFDWQDQGVPWAVTLFETGTPQFPLDNTQPEAFDDELDTTVILPNFIDPLPLKLVRIQLFFDGAVPLGELSFQVNAFDPTGTPGVVETDRGVDVSGLPSYFIDFQIRPNPDWEEIFIFGDTGANIVPGNLLRIEIDTISIPTPGAISVAAIAGLVGLRRRR